MLKGGEKNKPKREDMFRSFAAVLDYMHFFDENLTVNGFIVIMDFEHYSLKFETHVPMQDRREAAEAWQV